MAGCRRCGSFRMSLLFFSFLTFLTAATFSAAGLSAQESGPSGGALSILPSASDLKGWAPSGRPEVYQGEALYEYIDGGAEIYHEYGFREVAVQDFKSRSGKAVSVEVYLMSSAAGAYGMYTFKTTGEGRAMGWEGVEGEVESYYLNMWRGAVLATITGLDESPETRAGVIALGQATAAKMTGSLEKPLLIEGLPRAGLKPGTKKYLRGRLGLYNLRILFPGLEFPFHEGVRGLYDDGAELFIFAYKSAGEAAAAMALVLAAARKDERFAGLEVEGEGFTARDGSGAVTSGLAGRFVLVALAANTGRARELKDSAAATTAGR